MFPSNPINNQIYKNKIFVSAKNSWVDCSISEWFNYTPNINNLNVVSGSYKWRKVGDSMEFELIILGEPNSIDAISLSNLIPSGYTAASSIFPYSLFNTKVNLTGFAGNLGGMLKVFHNNSIGHFYSDYPSNINSWNNSTPITWLNNNVFFISGKITISQWSY